AVKRYRIQASFLVHVGVVLSLLVAVGVGSTVHYFSVARDASENRILRDENLTLKSQLKSIRERIEHIGATLDRVERFDQKLRAVTLLSDPQRNLAMGPTAGEPGPQAGSTDAEYARFAAVESPKALSSKLDKLSQEASRQEQ